ncbi:UvrABC system protein C [Frankliniella fusca]|uniref:UvrABC system protein C n=1 Tax=Frankliniella fusca TaxID=407009 RepID=A0AAE1HIS0_9NEOP|nr:UvrABC system protein C [Frankliniella fusca]
MTPPAKKLRSDSEILYIGYECDTIPSGKLPTTRQVMCYFFHLLRDPLTDKRSAARETVRVVASIWNKTKVPLIQEIKAIEKLEKFYTDWRNVAK